VVVQDFDGVAIELADGAGEDSKGRRVYERY